MLIGLSRDKISAENYSISAMRKGDISSLLLISAEVESPSNIIESLLVVLEILLMFSTI